MQNLKQQLLHKDLLEKREAVDNMRRQQVLGIKDWQGLENVTGFARAGQYGCSFPHVWGVPASVPACVFEDVEMFADRSFQHREGKKQDDGGDDDGERSSRSVFDALFGSGMGGRRGTCIASASPRDLKSRSTFHDPPSLGTLAFLRRLFETPVCDDGTLQSRCECLRRIIGKFETYSKQNDNNNDEMKKNECAVERERGMARLEADVMWAFTDVDDENAALYDMAYFTPWFARFLNRVPCALTALNLYKTILFPLMGVLGPIITFVVPYAVLRWKIGLNISFRTYLWIMYRSFVAGDISSLMEGGGGGAHAWMKYASAAVTLLFYFQSVFTAVEVSHALQIVCRCIDGRMRNVAAFLQRAAETIRDYWDDGVRDAFFPGIERPSDEHLRRAATDAHGIRSSGSMFVIGRSLSRFRCFDREAARRIVLAYYAVDAVSRAASLTCLPDYSLVEWITVGGSPKTSPTDTGTHTESPNTNTKTDANDPSAAAPSLSSVSSLPEIRFSGLWHPSLPPSSVVDNDLTVDPSNRPNILLTGPNAGGKSMFIKASILAVLMAQSVGVAPCRRSARLTPFSFISSQINVPDVKGARSLFEEEMYRAKANLDRLRRDADVPGALSFVVIDEIFSSTNPVEGISGAYSVALNLSKHKNAACIISTHYTYLCRLQKTTGGRFVNAQMPVIIRDQIDNTNDDSETEPDKRRLETDGNRGDEHSSSRFHYPYKVVPGVCRQYIALELLRESAFQDEVVEEALRVKKELIVD